MHEPVLQRAESLGRYKGRFRLLVLPNDDPGYAIRVDERTTGGAAARYVELDGAGGYAPGRIGTERRFGIDRDDMEAIERALKRVRLDSLQPDYSSEGESDDGTITICVHGTRFAFERVTRAGTSFVTRSVCDLTPEMRNLLNVLRPLTQR
jgi:hypothetical protein